MQPPHDPFSWVRSLIRFRIAVWEGCNARMRQALAGIESGQSASRLKPNLRRQAQKKIHGAAASAAERCDFCEKISLAGMQILAGTPPRVWAYALISFWEVQRGRAKSMETARFVFGRRPTVARATSPPMPAVHWFGSNASFVPI
jgi:hypothetical protein